MHNRRAEQILKEFPTNLRAVCDALPISHEEYALRAGISPSTLQRYMRGETTPSLENLLALEAAASSYAPMLAMLLVPSAGALSHSDNAELDLDGDGRVTARDLIPSAARLAASVAEIVRAAVCAGADGKLTAAEYGDMALAVAEHARELGVLESIAHRARLVTKGDARGKQ